MTLSERITQIYASSTFDGQALLTQHAHTLVDPILLGELERGQKPLTPSFIREAITRAELRHPAWQAKSLSAQNTLGR